MKKIKNAIFGIGSSAAASWAWGTSLIMGQQIAQDKGLTAWIIWAVCNALALALFGLLYKKKLITPELCEKKFVKIIALIIQLFCLLVQLNFINNQFLILTGNELLSYLITVGIGILFTMIVFGKHTAKRKKLEGEEDDTKDYKKMTFELINHPELLDNKNKKKLAQYFKGIIIKLGEFIDNKLYKRIYECILVGDPKERNKKAIIIRLGQVQANSTKVGKRR